MRIKGTQWAVWDMINQRFVRHKHMMVFPDRTYAFLIARKERKPYRFRVIKLEVKIKK